MAVLKVYTHYDNNGAYDGDDEDVMMMTIDDEWLGMIDDCKWRWMLMKNE